MNPDLIMSGQGESASFAVTARRIPGGMPHHCLPRPHSPSSQPETGNQQIKCQGQVALRTLRQPGKGIAGGQMSVQVTFAIDGGRQGQRHPHQRCRRQINEVAKSGASGFHFRHEISLEPPCQFHQWSHHQEPDLVLFSAMQELHGSRRVTMQKGQ